MLKKVKKKDLFLPTAKNCIQIVNETNKRFLNA